MQIDVMDILGSDDLVANPNAVILFGICIVVAFLAIYRSYRRPRTTKLRGPPSKNLIFGVSKELFDSSDLGDIYGNWEKAHGPVYEIPSTLGSTILVLQDPKAITHLYLKDTWTYHQFWFAKAVFGLVSFRGPFRAILIRSFDRPAMYW